MEDEDDDELEDDDVTFEAPQPTNATENFLYQAKAAFQINLRSGGEQGQGTPP